MAKRTKKLTLSLIDDTSQKSVFSWKTTRQSIILALCLAVVAVAAGTYLLISYTPLHHAIPGYPSEASHREAMENLVRMDSLERVVNMWELQVENISKVAQEQAGSAM